MKLTVTNKYIADLIQEEIQKISLNKKLFLVELNMPPGFDGNQADWDELGEKGQLNWWLFKKPQIKRNAPGSTSTWIPPTPPAVGSKKEASKRGVGRGRGGGAGEGEGQISTKGGGKQAGATKAGKDRDMGQAGGPTIHPKANQGGFNSTIATQRAKPKPKPVVPVVPPPPPVVPTVAELDLKELGKDLGNPVTIAKGAATVRATFNTAYFKKYFPKAADIASTDDVHAWGAAGGMTGFRVVRGLGPEFTVYVWVSKGKKYTDVAGKEITITTTGGYVKKWDKKTKRDIPAL